MIESDPERPDGSGPAGRFCVVRRSRYSPRWRL